MARNPVVAGAFYEGSYEVLERQIKGCFVSKLGPGLPTEKREKKIIGVIAPHAGYQFSGACAAYAYKEIAGSFIPDVFIMLGLSHHGFGSSISLDDWKTPFGIVKTDKEFGRQLAKNSGIVANEYAHSQEHSIEVQLPFLQFANRKEEGKIKVIPIIISPDVDIKDVSRKIAETIKKENKNACVITSSDFTHYGYSYGYLPFTKNAKENMYALDNGAIKHILNFDSRGFLEYCEKKDATICGKYPIAAAIELCKLLGAENARLLKYYTSGDVVGDYSSAVGYASVVFE